MTSIFFIIDGHGLEARAALLAATLSYHNGDRFHYVAYVTDHHRPILNPDLAALMQRCGVDLRPLPVSARPWAKPYPHGNKILAATDPRSGSHSVFLDSDIICAAPLDLTAVLGDRCIGAAPEGKPSWGKDIARWNRVYDHFDLPLPQDRIQLARGKQKAFLPYFNAGMIAFPNDPMVDGRRFADLWLDTALTIDHVVPVAMKRPWLDQISLPVTLKRFGLDYVLADESLNFSISDRTPLPSDSPVLVHYHRWMYLSNWPHLRDAALHQTRNVAGRKLYGALLDSYGDLWHSPALTQPTEVDQPQTA